MAATTLVNPVVAFTLACVEGLTAARGDEGSAELASFAETHYETPYEIAYSTLGRGGDTALGGDATFGMHVDEVLSSSADLGAIHLPPLDTWPDQHDAYFERLRAIDATLAVT